VGWSRRELCSANAAGEREDTKRLWRSHFLRSCSQSVCAKTTKSDNRLRGLSFTAFAHAATNRFATSGRVSIKCEVIASSPGRSQFMARSSIAQLRRDEEGRKVSVGVMTVSSSLPYFVALDQGFFTEQHIETEMTKFSWSRSVF
jgi:hypothetical protein